MNTIKSAEEIENIALKVYPVKERAKGLDPYDENKYDREKWIEGFKAALSQFKSKELGNVWVKARNFPHEDGFYCMRHHTINSLKEKFTSYDGKWFRNERWAYSVELDLDNWEWLDEQK